MEARLPDPTETLEVDVHFTAQLIQLPEEKRPLLIDCREQNEWDYCRIDGARLLPLSGWQQGAPTVEIPGAGIIIYCHHGVRSLHATQMLRRGDKLPIFSISGGIEHWSQIIDPSVPRY